MPRPFFLPDTFVLGLFAMVVLATVAPAQGVVASVLGTITTMAIAMLFFLHGARLSREAIVAGLTHWRLQLLAVAGTFVVFPLAVVGLRPVLEPLVPPPLYLGLMFLSIVPSTVQSAIALTSMARGNVPAAVCSASASTLLGLGLTPMLAGWLMGTQTDGGADMGSGAIGRIVLQLFVPYIAGHLLQPRIGAWVRARTTFSKVVDQGSILLVVYTAFSGAVLGGIWHQLHWASLLMLMAICAVLLALVLGTMIVLSRSMGFIKEDEITSALCGANKSLASGVPLANVLFPAAAIGPVVLPLMVFHQLQLMVCSYLANHWSRRDDHRTRAHATPH